MRSLSRGWASVIGLAVFAVAAAPVSAGLSYVSQERRVVAGTGDYTTPDPIDNGPLVVRSAAGFGPFDANVESEHLNASGQLDHSRSRQLSRLEMSSIRAEGAFVADAGDAQAQYVNRFHVVFDLTTASSFKLTSSLSLTDLSLTGYNLDDPLYTLRFSRSGETPIVDDRATDYELASTIDIMPVRSISRHGTLSPGRYELLLDIHTEFIQGREIGAYQLALTVGDGNAPPAVPLPSAVWHGFLTMAGILVGLALRRRCSHARDSSL